MVNFTKFGPENGMKQTNRKYVVVRTYSAGVHAGELAAHEDRQVTLHNARRIWSWSGALSLSEISQRGISGGKMSCTVGELILTEAIEIITCSKAGEAALRGFPEWKQ